MAFSSTASTLYKYPPPAMSDSPSIKEYPTTGSSHTVASDGDATLPPAPTLTPDQQRKLYRKLDLRLMPILSVMYLLASMDGGTYPPPA